jgi:hypothetical protein
MCCRFFLFVFMALVPLCVAAQNSEVTPTEIFSSFKQTDKGNCVVVAYIKASMAAFGMDSVFRSVKIDSVKAGDRAWISAVHAELLDGSKVNLDSFEVYTAFESSKFRLLNETRRRHQDIYNLSLVSYAILARNKVKVDGIDKKESDPRKAFLLSLRQLDDGSDATKAYRYLGIPSEYVVVCPRLSRTRGLNGMIVYSWKHAAFASFGRMDLWGRTKRIRKLYYFGRIRLQKPWQRNSSIAA